MKSDPAYPPLIPDTFFHIYNRGNNRENIFFCNDNYKYFLGLYRKYLLHFIDTYSYCLLPNHFHLLAKIKSESDLNKVLTKKVEEKIDFISELISEQFRKLFIAYSKAINNDQKRVGSLFQKNFKRKPLITDNAFKLLVTYIHTNPVHHSICDDYENYIWSSYGSIISDKATSIKRKELLEIFGGLNAFIEYHKAKHDFIKLKDVLFDH